jgi:hypothetical protein
MSLLCDFESFLVESAYYYVSLNISHYDCNQEVEMLPNFGVDTVNVYGSLKFQNKVYIRECRRYLPYTFPVLC